MYRFTVLLSNKRFHEILHSRTAVFIIQGALTVGSFLLSFNSHNVIYDKPVPRHIMLSPVTSRNYCSAQGMQTYLTPFYTEPVPPEWRMPPFDRNSSIVLCTYNNNTATNVLAVVSLGIFAGSELFCFAIAVAIFVNLRRAAACFSSRTREMHRQLIILLIAQVGSQITHCTAITKVESLDSFSTSPQWCCW